MSAEMSDAQWAKFTDYPFNRKLARLATGIECGGLVLPSTSQVTEISFNRRIHHFEANREHFQAWFDRLSDDIVAGSDREEPTPPAIVYYGPASIGSFEWEQFGFAVEPGLPIPGDLLQHPTDRRPLNDDPSSERVAVTAAIPTLQLLSNCGYTL